MEEFIPLTFILISKWLYQKNEAAMTALIGRIKFVRQKILLH